MNIHSSLLPHLDLLRPPGGRGKALVPSAKGLVDEDTGQEYAVLDGVPQLVDQDYDPELIGFYEDRLGADAADYAAVGYRFPLHYARVHRVAQTLLAEIPDGAVLADVGSGHGEMSAPAAERLTVIGVDLVQGFLRRAADRGLAPVRGSATALPFADESLDAVLCAELIQHLDDPQPLLKEAVRVTKPGGKILVSSINGSSVARRVNRAVRGLKQGDFVWLRTAAELAAPADDLAVHLDKTVWVMSPLAWSPVTTKPSFALETLAQNYFLVFTKA